MAVLRNPLMRRALGAALLLASSTVLAQAPATPAPSATAAAPVPPAAADRADKSAPNATAPAAMDGSPKVAPSAASPAAVDRSPKAAPSATAPAATNQAEKSAPAVVPAAADGAPRASESAVTEAAPAPQAPAATRQKTPGEEPLWEDPSIAAATAAEAEAEPESMGWMLIRTLLVLGAVVASIYLTLNVGLRRLMGLQGAVPGKQTVVSVVERLTLDPKRVLFVVKAADEYLLLGGGEAGLQLLSKLDLEAVERIRAQRPQTNVVPLSPFLQKLLSRRSGGSSSQPPGA